MSATGELVTPPIADRRAAWPERPAVRRAGRVLIAAAILGLIGQLLFFNVAIGVNFPIAIAMLVSGGWLLRGGPGPRAADAWLGPTAVAFAAFAAIRSDPALVTLDAMTALALAAGALASIGGREVVSRSIGGVIELGAGAAAWVVAGAIPAIADARRELPSGQAARRRAAPALPILRGIAIAIPLLIVFAALFASADAVFASVMEGVFELDPELGELWWRAVMAAMLAWLAAGGLALAATRPSADTLARPPWSWRLGSAELATALVAVNALFLVFVGLQAAYLFGGLDTLAASGLTYAEYARRGFFELVVVAMLAGAIVVVADRIARERTPAVVAAGISLALLTGVVLVSAALRTRLYQEAYGWTELRLYVLATIILLGIGLVALVCALVMDRVRWMGHALIIAALGIGFVLSVLGPARLITEQNVDRVIEPDLVPPNGSSGLDISYVAGLGDDAVPALLLALPALGEADSRHLGQELAWRLAMMREDPATGAWQAWNLGRRTALEALEEAEASGAIP